jgi:hypothetical protein
MLKIAFGTYYKFEVNRRELRMTPFEVSALIISSVSIIILLYTATTIKSFIKGRRLSKLQNLFEVICTLSFYINNMLELIFFPEKYPKRYLGPRLFNELPPLINELIILNDEMEFFPKINKKLNNHLEDFIDMSHMIADVIRPVSMFTDIYVHKINQGYLFDENYIKKIDKVKEDLLTIPHYTDFNNKSYNIKKIIRSQI